MFRNGWLAAITLGSCLVFWPALSQPMVANHQVEREYGEQVARKTSQTTSTVISAVTPIDRASNKRDERAAKDIGGISDDHLIWGDGFAQWAMALTGIIALFISGWAVWLLYQTLAATRAAVAQAEIGTEAAVKAVDVTRRIGEAQVRAYVTVLAGFTPKPPGNGKIGVYLRMTNHGHSPAFALEIENKVTVVNQRVDDLPPFYPMPKVIELIPNNEFRDTIVEIDGVPNLFEGIASGDVVVYNYGVLRYRDVFGNPQETRYRLRCEPQRAMGGFLFVADGDGIQMT